MNQPLTYQIDRVLYFFSLSQLNLPNGTVIVVVNPYSRLESKKIISEVFPELHDDQSFDGHFNSILEKLAKDGFLKINEQKISSPESPVGGRSFIARVTQKEGIFITFEGRLWLEQGAYAGQAAQNSEVETRNRNSYNLNWILGIGAVVVGVGTLFQCFDYYEKHSFELQKGLYFFSGCGVGLLIVSTIVIIRRMIHKN